MFRLMAGMLAGSVKAARHAREDGMGEAALMDTPCAALEELRQAVRNRDGGKFAERIDFRRLFDRAYEEATEHLAAHCAEYHALYPKDLFFQFGPEAVRAYNRDYREVHEAFFGRFLEAYFDKELRFVRDFDANPVRFCAFAFRKLHGAMKSRILKSAVSGDRATIDFEISGGYFYRKLIGTLRFELGFERGPEGAWRLVAVENVDALAPPILAMAETWWPKSWDLGMKF